MKDKKLLDLLDNYLLFNEGEEKEELKQYINNNDISKEDYKKLSLVLIQKNLFDYIDCNNFKKVINNIDNIDFMNDEDNY